MRMGHFCNSFVLKLKIFSIGSITLKDFKESLNLKHGSSYTYHFKAQDPEFGVVKEV